LRELFPKSRLPELSNWMGFRPSLPDHLPVIGISPLHRNAIFAFGHQHLGLTLAGVTADIVDDLISGIEPAVDLRPFRADRF
jgi:D-amino-acid dehydrogenase